MGQNKKRQLSLVLTIFLSFFCTKTFARSKLLLSHTPTIKEVQIIKNRPNLVIFDTSRREKYYYQPLIDIASAANFDVTYYSIDRMIDTPEDKIPLDKFDCAFFVSCPEFLKTMRISSISKKILSIINKFSNNENKMSVLMFPSIKVTHPNPIGALTPIFKRLKMGASEQSIMFARLTNNFLRQPIESRPLDYQTSLRLKDERIKKHKNSNIAQITNDRILPVALLPIEQNTFSEKIKSIFPLGVYYFNNQNKNHIVVTSTSLLFSGISENFQLCPLKFDVRKEVHSALNEMVWELNRIVTQKKSINGIDSNRILSNKKNELPFEILSIGQTLSKTNNQKKNKVAWMEIKNKQKKLVKFILDSKLDHLWVTINPHMYYSPIGRNKKDTKNFLQKVSTFTKHLSKESAKRGVKPPSILIGFEITNNIYKPNLPQQKAWDLYGNNYPDIPRPLNLEFWENEIKNPLTTFLEKWKDPKISNGIKISGVVLDLEMYCRKTTGAFLPTMGFEPETIGGFAKPLSTRIFSQYLLNNSESKNYFDYLEKKSVQLGQQLKNFFQEKIPGGIIGCYAPNISTDWFYKGLYNGLSEENNPIHLLTFNTEFNSHKEWLKNNGIHAYHLSVLMLSKIRKQKHFALTNYILKHHDGIWLNRFSRLAEETDINKRDWTYLERTPLNIKERELFANYLGTTTAQAR